MVPHFWGNKRIDLLEVDRKVDMVLSVQSYSRQPLSEPGSDQRHNSVSISVSRIATQYICFVCPVPKPKMCVLCAGDVLPGSSHFWPYLTVVKRLQEIN